MNVEHTNYAALSRHINLSSEVKTPEELLRNRSVEVDRRHRLMREKEQLGLRGTEMSAITAYLGTNWLLDDTRRWERMLLDGKSLQSSESLKVGSNQARRTDVVEFHIDRPVVPGQEPEIAYGSVKLYLSIQHEDRNHYLAIVSVFETGWDSNLKMTYRTGIESVLQCIPVGSIKRPAGLLLSGSIADAQPQEWHDRNTVWIVTLPSNMTDLDKDDGIDGDEGEIN